MEDELVEVGRFPSSFEASLARRELEEAGISARLANEASSEWMTHLGAHDVGVALLTTSADAKTARSILQKSEQAPPSPGDADAEAGEGYDEDEGSGPEDWAKRALLAACFGLFMFPFSLYAIWLLIHHGLLSKRNRGSIRGPLTILVVAVIGLVINLSIFVGQFFQ